MSVGITSDYVNMLRVTGVRRKHPDADSKHLALVGKHYGLLQPQADVYIAIPREHAQGSADWGRFSSGKFNSQR